tara:strand:+ start:463 stop:576 length:114 start_codon:yes stop_codon:yes gene_type:complete
MSVSTTQQWLFLQITYAFSARLTKMGYFAALLAFSER